MEPSSPLPAYTTAGFFEKFSTMSRVAIVESSRSSQRSSGQATETWHLLFALLELTGGTAVAILSEGTPGLDTLRSIAKAHANADGPSQLTESDPLPLTPELKQTMRNAAYYAQSRNDSYVRTGDLLLALLDEPTSGARQTIGAGRIRRARLRKAAWQHLIVACDLGDELAPVTSISVDATATIAAPTADVWDAVADIDQYTPVFRGSELLHARRFFVAGTEYRLEVETRDDQGDVSAQSYSVFEERAEQRLTVVSDAGVENAQLKWTTSWILHEHPVGTLLELRHTLNVRSPTYGWSRHAEQAMRAVLTSNLQDIERAVADVPS